MQPGSKEQNWTFTVLPSDSTIATSTNGAIEINDDTQSDFSQVNKTGYILAIVVITAYNNTERRTVIRQTWAINLPKFVKIFFVLGAKLLSKENKTIVENENKLYSDLIILPDLEDRYELLTDKIIATMKWISEKNTFDYLLKVDDDTYVRVDRFVEALQTKPRDKLYWGFFNNGSEIVKKGKWAESEPYICGKYVSYALGGGYVLSKDLVRYIVDNADKFKKFVNEDVSIGTWLAPFKLNRFHDGRFRMKGDCREDYILYHEAIVEDMNNFNKSLTIKKSFCHFWVKRSKKKEKV